MYRTPPESPYYGKGNENNRYNDNGNPYNSHFSPKYGPTYGNNLNPPTTSYGNNLNIPSPYTYKQDEYDTANSNPNANNNKIPINSNQPYSRMGQMQTQSPPIYSPRSRPQKGNTPPPNLYSPRSRPQNSNNYNNNSSIGSGSESYSRMDYLGPSSNNRNIDSMSSSDSRNPYSERNTNYQSSNDDYINPAPVPHQLTPFNVTSPPSVSAIGEDFVHEDEDLPERGASISKPRINITPTPYSATIENEPAPYKAPTYQNDRGGIEKPVRSASRSNGPYNSNNSSFNEPVRGASARVPIDEPVRGASVRNQYNDEPVRGASIRDNYNEPVRGASARNQYNDEPVRGASARAPIDEPVRGASSRAPMDEPVRGASTRAPMDEPVRGASASAPIDEPMRGASIRDNYDEPVRGVSARDNYDEPVRGVSARGDLNDKPGSGASACDLNDEPVRGASIRDNYNEPIRGASARGLNDEPVRSASITHSSSGSGSNAAYNRRNESSGSEGAGPIKNYQNQMGYSARQDMGARNKLPPQNNGFSSKNQYNHYGSDVESNISSVSQNQYQQLPPRKQNNNSSHYTNGSNYNYNDSFSSTGSSSLQMGNISQISSYHGQGTSTIIEGEETEMNKNYKNNKNNESKPMKGRNGNQRNQLNINTSFERHNDPNGSYIKSASPSGIIGVRGSKIQLGSPFNEPLPSPSSKSATNIDVSSIMQDRKQNNGKKK